MKQTEQESDSKNDLGPKNRSELAQEYLKYSPNKLIVMNFRGSLLYFFAIIISSCFQNSNKIFVFDPKKISENPITLSEISEDIIYIALDNSIPVSEIHTPHMNNSTIAIFTREGIAVFDSNGMNAKRIGKTGRGLGEYVYGTEFALDDSTGRIYVLDIGNIVKVYSRDGDYLNSIHLATDTGDFQGIEFFNNNLFLYSFMQYGNHEYDWVIYDTQGSIINRKKRNTPYFASNWLASGGTFKYDNTMSYWNPYLDTVFTFHTEYKCNSTFVFNAGEFRLPKSEFEVAGKISDYMNISTFFETKDFWVLKYSYKRIGVIVFINKTNEANRANFVESYNYGGIKNDLDGGLDFQPLYYFENGNSEYIVDLINPGQLINHVGNDKFLKSRHGNPVKKLALIKLAENIKETDNPVLMIVKLKR